MAYEPHTWTSGEVVTAQKMNALEQGAAQGGGVVAHAEYDDSTGSMVITDMTAGEMWNFFSTGTPVVVMSMGDEFEEDRYMYSVISAYYLPNLARSYGFSLSTGVDLGASTADDYPSEQNAPK